MEFLLEAFLEFAVHRLLLEFLGWGVYLKIVVSVLLVLHLCELDGLLLQSSTVTVLASGANS